MSWTMISYLNSFPGIQPWFHNIIHSTKFTHESMIMNSYMISLSWIYLHEFRNEFIQNSDTWFHDILHDHEFISEFISEFIQDFMIMDSYATFHDLGIHTWIHVNEGYCEIITEIKCTKIPDVGGCICASIRPALQQTRHQRRWVQQDCTVAAGVSRSCASSRGEWCPHRRRASHASGLWGCWS